MARAGKFRIVLVTCGSEASARKIAKSVVEERLAACVNIFSAPVQSLYRWKGAVENARERLLIIKTSAKQLKKLEEEVMRLHSYQTPEFLVLAVTGGSKEYLAWLGASLG